MRIVKVSLLLVTSLALTNCSYEFPATAQVGHEQQYTGTVEPTFSHKEYAIDLDSSDQTTHCNGLLQVSSPNGVKFGCTNQRGVATFQCDNGNHLTGSFYATSCESGVGYGQDQNGERFSFRYGDAIH